jgi:hypothetical protein
MSSNTFVAMGSENRFFLCVSNLYHIEIHAPRYMHGVDMKTSKMSIRGR